jgi:hypothetical protein
MRDMQEAPLDSDKEYTIKFLIYATKLAANFKNFVT